MNLFKASSDGILLRNYLGNEEINIAASINFATFGTVKAFPINVSSAFKELPEICNYEKHGPKY